LASHYGQEEAAMRYLLGTLSEEERTRFEELYFSDDAEFEGIEIAEEELIDRYVRGELSSEDQSRFERTLAASPRLTERVRFATVLKNKLAGAAEPATVAVVQTAQPKTSWFTRFFGFSQAERAPRWAIAFTALLAVAFIVLFVSWRNLREESKRLAAQEAQMEQRQRELDKQLAELKSQRDQLASQTSPGTYTGRESFAVAETRCSRRSSYCCFVAVSRRHEKSGCFS
jgi:anti-sigma factor RsiW